jgi:hypothetical protein
VKPARKRQQVWHPADYDIADIRAIQAVTAGTATPEQQQRALDWIVVRAAATYDNGFLAEDGHGRIAASSTDGNSSASRSSS